MRSRSGVRSLAPLVVLAVSSMVLVGCGGGGSGGTTTLQWYGPPDSAGATDLVVKDCNKQSNGAYKLVNNPLPSTADGQREKLVAMSNGRAVVNARGIVVDRLLSVAHRRCRQYVN